MPDLARIVADVAAGIQATKGHRTVADYIASLGKVDPEHFRSAVVGGGIFAIVPGKASIAVWSPASTHTTIPNSAPARSNGWPKRPAGRCLCRRRWGEGFAVEGHLRRD